MTFRQTIGQRTHLFRDLKDLIAKATPLRSGDQLAGIAATSAEEMVAARMVLADQPLKLGDGQLRLTGTWRVSSDPDGWRYQLHGAR